MSDRGDDFADLILGVIFGTGVGFCVIGLAFVALWAVFPGFAPGLLALAGR
jgi:hypothetical protein